MFETIPVIGGIPYLWDAHLARLQVGLERLSIPGKMPHLRQQLVALIAQNSITNGIARIFISRGAGSQGYLPTYASDPTTLLETESNPPPIAGLSDASDASRNLYLSSWRRFPPDCLPNDTKLMQGVNATLARLEAQQSSYDDALLLSTDDTIAETSSGNLFWLEGETLHTPSLTTGCLAGTMRARLLYLWGGTVTETMATLDQLSHADACVMTNALHGSVAISSIHSPAISMQFSDSRALAKRCNALIHMDIRQDTAVFRQKYLAGDVTPS